jgi:hypothetical protein
MPQRLEFALSADRATPRFRLDELDERAEWSSPSLLLAYGYGLIRPFSRFRMAGAAST